VSRRDYDGGLGPGVGSVVLGLDPSLTKFGLTALRVDGEEFYTWVYTCDLRGSDRLADIQQWLEDKRQMIRDDWGYAVSDVGMESGVFHSQSAFVLGELSAAVKLWARKSALGLGRYPLKVAPQHAKKFATDNGSARKVEVMLACYRKWNVEFKDDNAADSYVIARVVRALTVPPTLAYEQGVVDRILAGDFRDGGL
jgi:Holliday junction resolvasome RuvABC endonuclease subunit